MTKSRLDRFLAPWVFVSIGVVFNVLSAVITHYSISLNNDEINDIDRQIQGKQVLIDSLWQSKIGVERKKEFFILLLSIEPGKRAATDNHYRDYLSELVNIHYRTNQRCLFRNPCIAGVSNAARARQFPLIQLLLTAH